MLSALFIRNIVLIEQLDLEFGPGLCVLSGETGAGKSILLDSLSLALGGRGDGGLVRKGAQQGSVTAVFERAEARTTALLEENGLEPADPVILRRVQYADGRTRAFVNDMPVNAGLLRKVGEALAEIHGQHDARLLAEPSSHRDLLDAFGGHEDDLARVAGAHGAWQGFRRELDALTDEIAKAERDSDYLAHAAAELEQLDPQADEEEGLAERRQLLMNSEKIAAGLNEAAEALGEGLTGGLNSALRRLERLPQSGGLLAPVLEAMERALAEAQEAEAALEAAMRAARHDPDELEQAEARLFALRAAARKHQTSVSDLPDLLQRLQARLEKLGRAEHNLHELRQQCASAETAYFQLAGALSVKRREAAARLDSKVMDELGPLKLERAVFHTKAEADLSLAGPQGQDRVEFMVATNPGADPGPLAKIASGGELSRFMLALKVSLAARGGAPVLVFDEIDAGVGGAVADAVGARLARLAGDAQVLVVTHSPQVAARGQAHYLVRKQGEAEELPQVGVDELTGGERREEIARMLSGADITDEARAAAARLLETRA
ncbi:MAG: DNA repair protein RecN [Hyphomicrobiales bacterium]|nr:MAG: DNA repair protein RecN [Hyphomicrobiales bacterium]